MPVIHIDDTNRDPTECSRETWDTDDTQQATAMQHGRALEYKSTDADQIRDLFGIPPFDISAYTEIHTDNIAWPDLVVHEKRATKTKSNKGTDCLFRGDRDSGKTTLARNISPRLMDENGEKVIWRGRKDGSGWLPFRHWATVHIPAKADVSPVWMDEDDERGADEPRQEVGDLESVVRTVNEYEGIYDLLDALGEAPEGTFHVVYPDPTFTDCEEITRETDRGQFAGALPFIPEYEAEGETTPTPLTDWWAPFLIARVERGPFDWMTWLCDEAGDLFPEGARNDDDRHLHDLIDMLRAAWAESRKRYLSLFMFVHHEENLHNKLRREFKWRVAMPDGRPNPVSRSTSTHPLGFRNAIPMDYDMMSDNEPEDGALCYTKRNWSKFGWSIVDDLPADENRWLSIRVEAPEEAPQTPGEETEDTAPPELEYDHTIFGEWQNASAHRLIVKDPGDGYISVHGAAIGEELVSPVDGLTFEPGLRDRGDHREVVMTDGSEEIVVARVPIDEQANGQVGGVAGD